VFRLLDRRRETIPVPATPGTSPTDARDASADRNAARRRNVGVACVVISAAAFGAMAILARFAFASGVDTVTLLALRFAIGSVLMLAMVRARGAAMPRGTTLGVLIALGALGYGGQAITYFTALSLAPAGLAALLLYLHPALVALLAAVFLHERMTAAKLGALAIALAGTTLTVAPAIGGDAIAGMPQVATGLVFAVASAAFYAVYIVVAAAVGARAQASTMSAVVITSAAIVFVAAMLIRGPHWPQTAAGWTAVVAIALLSTVLAITLYFAGLERIGPVRASTLSTIEPLCTVVLAAIVLDETLAPVQLAGGVLILASAVAIARVRGA
jgi:drug/metabolite transporter (DMT)-like permease